MKKSSGYGSALSPARAISVSARAGTAALSAAAAASHTASGRWVSLACSQSSAAATSPQRTSSQRHSRLSGVAAFFKDSASRKARFMASAKRCQRRERRLLNDIRHVASGLGSSYPPPPAGRPRCSRGSVSASKPRRRRRRFQTARCARRGGQSAARRSPPGWRRCRWGFTTGARAAACRRLTLAETKKSKGEQYGVGNSIVT